MSDREPRPSLIPDEWYENDIGPDPERMDVRCPPAVRQAYMAGLLERIAEARAGASGSIEPAPETPTA